MIRPVPESSQALDASDRPRTPDAPRVTPALEAKGVWKRFGRTVAVRDVDFELQPGVIRGLVGENGAGKSTFLGIAAGRVRASAGHVKIHGHDLPLGNPRAARALGLAAVYQELELVPAADAVSNVFLGHELTKGAVLDRRTMVQRFEGLCERMQIAISPSVAVRELSVGDQQMVEIMRGLNADASVIVLDEPTSALQRFERERLFAALRDLRGSGVSSVFISHDLGDVIELADEITVFRNGSSIATRASSDWSRTSLVAAMLGEGAASAIAQVGGARRGSGDTVLGVRKLSSATKLRDISFDVREGEIVGLGGLAGSGRSTTLRALAGAHGRGATGSLELRGRSLPVFRSPAQGLENGVALIPEDRKTSGLSLGMSALENIMLPTLRGTGMFLRARETRRAVAAAERAGFDPARLSARARDLSGGNQQKLLLARWINAGPAVLLADEPTRGVDIGAKSDILRTLRSLADDGMSMIIASSDLEDLEMIADRVIVLANGEIIDELDRDQDGGITPATILRAAIGTAGLLARD